MIAVSYLASLSLLRHGIDRVGPLRRLTGTTIDLLERSARGETTASDGAADSEES